MSYTPKFKISYPNPETIIFLLDDEEIAYANHDNHGWTGMEAMEKLFEAIATHINVQIEHDHSGAP